VEKTGSLNLSYRVTQGKVRTFMLDRQILHPPGYAERSCLLVSYRLPWLPYCYVLCHEPNSDGAIVPVTELMSFFLLQAEQLAVEATDDPQAFMLIHSGTSVRKRSNWHMHVFVIQHRWQKAWIYMILGAKNLAVIAATGIRSITGHRSTSESNTLST